MLTSKNKGQISVEALIIVGVLVVGGVIFATIYLGEIASNSRKASDLSGITDDFMNGLGDWGTPDYNGSAPSCIDRIQNQGETGIDCGGPCSACFIPAGCGDGTENGLETGVDCGGKCPPCIVPGELGISLSLYPNSFSLVNTDFGVIVLMTNDTGHLKDAIKNISIQKYNATSTTWENTSKCSFRGEYNSNFPNLDILFNGGREIKLSFSCAEVNKYKITVDAGILGDTTAAYNDTEEIEKTITPAPAGCATPGVCGETDSCPTCLECCPIPTPTFSISITSPEEGKAFFNNQDIKLTAVDSDISRTGPMVCEWYIGDNYIPASKSCDYPPFNLSAIDPGDYKVKVFATKEIDGVTLSSKDEKNISIYKFDTSALYLLEPGAQIVGKEFNLKVSSLDQAKVSGVAYSNINFSGTVCTIDQTRVSGILTESINETTVYTVYYKTFPTTCSQANYSAPEVLNDVYAKLTGGVDTPFQVGYDLSLNFVACGSNASNYGLLNACVLSDSGSGYNSNYYNNTVGLLKVSVNIGEGTTVSNNYGTLSVYIE